jgi:predicted dehydrogenase
MEKPGGTRLADFERLINIMSKTGNVFHTGYMYRYNPYINDTITKAKNGELGEIISVEAQMNCILPSSTRQWLEALPGGMMFYLGCHLVDLVLQIKGQPDKIIPLNKSSGVDGVTSKDFGMAVFEYENGISFVKTAACEIGGYARRQLVVSGTKGTVELKPFEMFDDRETHYTVKTEYNSEIWNDMGKNSKSEKFDRYDNMMKSFAEYVRGEKSNPYTPDFELELYKTILKACGQNL